MFCGMNYLGTSTHFLMGQSASCRESFALSHTTFHVKSKKFLKVVDSMLFCRFLQDDDSKCRSEKVGSWL
jgi:hypothetical protein